MQKIIIVSGPVIIEDDKVLLDKDHKDDFWKFCGGKIKNSESLEETVKRRSKEELGIETEIINPEPFLLYTKKETLEGDLDIILVHFLSSYQGEITPGEDIREWKWIPLEELENENLAPNILPVLKHFGFLE
ncbi:MAG: NUDIX hydrolase [Patescibacteria group bacterium]|jgi:nucleoside triphosphatase|nr:NUDIX hydrolase [Patescibacteria group bacterium]